MRIKYDQPQARTAVIFLDGANITTLAVEASSDEGWADVVLFGAGGVPMLDQVGNPLVVRLHGRVIIGQQRKYINHLTSSASPSPYTLLLDLKQPHFSES